MLIIMIIIICVKLPLFCKYVDNKRLARLFMGVVVDFIFILFSFQTRKSRKYNKVKI